MTQRYQDGDTTFRDNVEVLGNLDTQGNFTTPGTATIYGATEIRGLIANPGGIKIQSADVTKNANTTFADLTGLSVTVVAGKTYIVRAVLFATLSVAGGAKFQFGGTCTVTSGLAQIHAIEAANNATVIFAAKSTPKTLAGFQGTGSGPGTDMTFFIDATIVINAGGTLTLQFAQQVSNASNCIIKAASMMEVKQATS